MHLTYGAFKRYADADVGCPERFRRQNINKEWPVYSKHFTVFGSVIQAVFEHFYKDEMWKHPDTVQQELIDLVPDEMSRYLEKEFVDWNSPHFHDDQYMVEADVVDHIPPVLQAILDHELLGERNLSEFYLKGRISKEHSIGGQVDFLIYRGNDILIVDGKGGKTGPNQFKRPENKHKYKNISKDQLLYYALAYFLKKGKLPSILAFLWYRFADDTDTGYDTETMWDELHWVKADIRDLRDRIVKTLDAISREEFDGNPSSKACRYCPFKDPGPGQCEAWRGWQKTKKRRKMKTEVPKSGDFTMG